MSKMRADSAQIAPGSQNSIKRILGVRCKMCSNPPNVDKVADIATEFICSSCCQVACGWKSISRTSQR
jgi:hypothetical protein